MRKKWISILLSMIMIASTLVGCGMATHVGVEPINDGKSIKREGEILAVGELDRAYIEGLNGFAYDIFDQLLSGDNVFISPYSISLALSMLYNGADQETRAEMAEMLGFDRLTNYTSEYDKEANDYMNANARYLMNSLHEADLR